MGTRYNRIGEAVFNVYPQSMFWAKILKISSFPMKLSIFAAEKYHIAWASLRNVLKIGMNSLILWSPLLKFRMIVCLNLLLLWELGTNPLRSNPILLVWYCQVNVSPINYSNSDVVTNVRLVPLTKKVKTDFSRSRGGDNKQCKDYTNQRTNGPVNAHLRSGIYTNKLGRQPPWGNFFT